MLTFNAPRPLTTFTVALNSEDTDAFLAMMQALGCSTPDALIRIALWNQAHVSDLDLPTKAFSLTKSRWVEPVMDDIKELVDA